MGFIGRKYRLYNGVWLTSFFMILFPILCTVLLYTCMHIGICTNKTTAVYFSHMFGFYAGSLYHLAAIICGLMNDHIMVVIERIRNFFSDLSVSPKLAFKCYFKSIKDDGMIFWVYFLIIAGTFFVGTLYLVKSLIYFEII